jgi:hypothetical protein
MIDWTQELEDEIVTRLASCSLRKLCEEDPSLPSRNTITQHMVKNDEFATKCMRARRENALYRLEKAQDQLDAADGEKITLQEVKLLELRLGDARWLSERLLSKEYGNKTQAHITGADEGPVQFVVKNILDQS